MRKISIDDVDVGMIIAADIFDPDFGADLPLLARGVTLTEKYISKLQERGLDELLIVTPPDYRGAPGETLVLQKITGNVVSEGNLEVQCDIPAGQKIAASENIFINGTVNAGCSIISANGNIVIEGGIAGNDNHRVIINAGKMVTIENNSNEPVSCADIKALDEIAAKGNIKKCSLSAKGRLFVDGTAVQSNIYSHSRIRLKECGGKDSEHPCKILVKPAECRELFQKLLTLDRQLASLEQDKERQKNSINLVKKLCKDIDSLSQDKKMSLALDIKLLQETDGKIYRGQMIKEKLKQDVLKTLEMQRIFIDETIHPNTNITIENCSLTLEKKMQSVAFYVLDMKIKSMPIR